MFNISGLCFWHYVNYNFGIIKIHIMKLFTITMLLMTISVFSQDCSCEENFNWLKQTFEKNDAGFSYALETKGEIAYAIHNDKYIEKVKRISSPDECLKTMYNWLTFFRSGHLGLNRISGNNNNNVAIQLTEKEIIENYKETEKLDININTFKKYLKTKTKVDYEGIWRYGSYTIGIKKIKDNYVGFIIEADGVYWTKGQIKLKINKDNVTDYYMKNHSKNEFYNTELIGNNYLIIGNDFARFKRVTPIANEDNNIDRYFKILDAKQPYFKKIDANTTYLRIPSFQRSHKQVIDSVIAVNKDIIINTPNLVIDIRNNGGGNDSSYSALLPILYTNTIREVGVGFYSTKLNNQILYDFLISPEANPTEASKQWAKEAYDKLSNQLGTYVNLHEKEIITTEYDTIYEYPKNIGIIINDNNVSTAEQFLLAAKQSKKVKLYGTTTKGALDISNIIATKSPCGDFELEYCMSRSFRIPDMAIDEKGIQPDFFIDKTIPKYKWLAFVVNSLKV